MIIGVEQTTWDLIGQISVWFIGFPALLVFLGWYIFRQVVNERRANQQLEGRWGLDAKSRQSSE